MPNAKLAIRIQNFFGLFLGLLAIIGAVVTPALAHEDHKDEQGHKAVVFYNAACSGCSDYLQIDLEPLLRRYGVNAIDYKDFINQPEYRGQMREKLDQLKIPDAYLAHIMVFVDDRLVIAGHVPEKSLMPYLTKLPDRPVVLFQDEMTDIANRQVKTWRQGETATAERLLLPTVLFSGFIDGLNPCAFAVLLFFIAFLLTLSRSGANIWRMGLVYISAIYLAYLLIGLGLMKAVIFSGRPHFMAKLGSWLMIVLGTLNLVEYFFPKFPVKMQIPRVAQGPIKHWLTKATLPSVFVGGFLVGLCTFPCSGSIYVGITTMLAATQTYFKGVVYLLLYNLAFVSPLIPVLAAASNRRLLASVARSQRRGDRLLKLGLGLFSLILGAVILLFFVKH